MKRFLFLCLCLGTTGQALAAISLGCISVQTCSSGEKICEYRSECGWDVCYCSIDGVDLGDVTCSSSNCTSDTTWQTYSTGYNVKRTRECQSNICTVTATEYACASGYYGTPTSSSTGCTACPLNALCLGGTTFTCHPGYYQNETACAQCPDGGKSVVGSDSITDCYLASGTEISDTSGSGTYTGDCYYTN